MSALQKATQRLISIYEGVTETMVSQIVTDIETDLKEDNAEFTTLDEQSIVEICRDIFRDNSNVTKRGFLYDKPVRCYQ